MGNFTISDTVFRQIAEYICSNMPSMYKIIRTRVENKGDGPDIYMEVTMEYGFNIIDELNKFKKMASNEILKLTSMQVAKMQVVAKNIRIPEK